MTAALRRIADLPTIADLLAFLDAGPDRKAELIGGRIVLMTSPTGRHNQIAGNIYSLLRGPMRRRGCATYMSDILVRRRDIDTFAAMPDVFVRCGPPPPPTLGVFDDPVVIFEVLSRSTEAFDRADKFANYTKIESLQAYVLVHQREPRIETWLRNETFAFEPAAPVTDLAAALELSAIEATLPLNEIYDGVVFGD